MLLRIDPHWVVSICRTVDHQSDNLGCGVTSVQRLKTENAFLGGALLDCPSSDVEPQFDCASRQTKGLEDFLRDER